MVQFFFTAIQPCPYSPTLTTPRYEKREREKEKASGKMPKTGKLQTTDQKNRWQEHLPPTLKGLITRGLESQGAWTPAVEVRNRFKGLDLTDRVPDELWMQVRDIVQKTESKTIPKKKKCKMAV